MRLAKSQTLGLLVLCCSYIALASAQGPTSPTTNPPRYIPSAPSVPSTQVPPLDSNKTSPARTSNGAPALGATPKPVPAAPKALLPVNMDMVLSRETPRKLLETFYFAVEGADFRPDLLATAAQCLDNRILMADANNLALFAVHLSEVLDHFDISHIAAPDKPAGNSFVLLKEKEFQITMREIPGDGWKFDAETVIAIPEMRRDLTPLRSAMGGQVKGMVDGRQSPEATARTFRAAIARGDFLDAASCIDSTGYTSRRWVMEGPGIARQLALIIQRCGFVFANEFPNDSNGPRYTWFASPQGMISLVRVANSADGKEGWVFDRTTIQSLPSLLQAMRKMPPDPRWTRLGLALDDSILRDERIIQKTKKGEAILESNKRPEGLPVGLETPKATLDTFFKEIERTRVTSKASTSLEACLDLEPARKRLGVNVRAGRAGIMLDAILRSFELDTTVVSDVWNDDPQTLKGPNGAEVTLRRTEDGSWKFDFDTLIRMPDMFSKLGPGMKNAREKLHDYDTPRNTFTTFEWSMYQGKFNPSEIQAAVDCLDLSGVPLAARDTIAPRLAWKIRYIMDHENVYSGQALGSTTRRFNIPQLISNLPDGRRWSPYRDERGDALVISRMADGPRKDKWLFSADSLDRCERLFHKVIGLDILDEVANAYPRESDPKDRIAYWYREGPTFFECPAVWMHLRMSPFWRAMTIGDITIGLERWQWVGLILCFVLSYLVGWLGTQCINLVVLFGLSRLRNTLPRGTVFQRLGPIRVIFGFAMLLYGIECLDLPMKIEIALLPICKTVWALLLLWTSLGIIDLGRDLYSHRHDNEGSSSFQDLLLPTVVGLIKAFFILGFGYYLIRLMGDEDLLGRILAGVGILTLGVSLAAQDAIKNYFGTLLLASERPFRIGDRVRLEKAEGVIERVGYRSTRIRTDKGSLITLPNSKVIEGAVENLGRRNRHFERMALPLSSMPTEANAEILENEIKAILRTLCPKVKKPPFADIIMGESGAMLVINAWVPGWGGAAAIQSRDKLLVQIASVVAAHGLVITGPPQSPVTVSITPQQSLIKSI